MHGAPRGALAVAVALCAALTSAPTRAHESSCASSRVEHLEEHPTDPSEERDGEDSEAPEATERPLWADAVVEIAIDPALLAAVPDAYIVLEQAIARWECSGANLPELRISDDLENTPNKLRLDDPEAGDVGKAVAITRTTFDSSTRTIKRGEIVLGLEKRFADTSLPGADEKAFDLESVLVHELGHFLGFGEDYENRAATMYASAAPGQTNKRSISRYDADKAVIAYGAAAGFTVPTHCALDEPAPVESDDEVNEEPVHAEAISCAVQSGRSANGAPFALLALALTLGFSWRRSAQSAGRLRG